jgi:glycosyltransferase involved in cell wall biosynthesis
MADAKENLVSIVIPCYNAEEFVGEAIDSALAQTYEPTEVIVIDDGSQDNSPGVVRSYGDQITWRQQENQGAPAARNHGLRLASGRFVKFLDADDALYPEAVETQVEQTREISDERAIVFGDGRLTDEDLTVTDTTNCRARRDGEDLIAYILRSNPQTSLPLHLRSLLEEVGGFDEQLPRAQEYDLHLRLALAGVGFRYRPAPVGMIRQHSRADRITNQTHLPAEPKRGRNRVRKIKEAGKLSEPVRRVMSKGAWQAGRTFLRQGRPHDAEKRFDLARELHSDCVAGASPAYKWCVGLLGPQIAERIAEWVR